MFYYYLIFTFILTLFTFLENNFKKYNKNYWILYPVVYFILKCKNAEIELYIINMRIRNLLILKYFYK